MAQSAPTELDQVLRANRALSRENGHLRRTIEALSLRLDSANRGYTPAAHTMRLASSNVAGDAWADNHSRRSEWRRVAGLAPKSDAAGDVIPATIPATEAMERWLGLDPR